MRLHAAVPTLELADAYAHVEAAEVAATDEITVELLLGVAFVESRFDPTAVSRVQAGTRHTGRYASTAVPAQLDPRAGLFCGPLQTYARSWSACLGMRDLRRAYATAVAELTGWLRDRRTQGKITRALAGHGCGNYGVTSGNCNGYPGRVLWMEHQFRIGSEPRIPAARAVASNT